VTTRKRPPNAPGSSRVTMSCVERTIGPRRRLRSEKSGLITRLARRRHAGDRSSSPKELVEDRRSPAWLEHAFRFAQSAFGLGHDGEDQVQNDRIERVVLEGELARIHDARVDRDLQASGSLPTSFEHRRRDVHRGDGHFAGQILEVQPRAGADEEHASARMEPESLDGTSPRAAEVRSSHERVVPWRPHRVAQAIPHDWHRLEFCAISPQDSSG
jgi:hypothetical protein